MKKSLCLLMAALMLSVCFSGCKQKSKQFRALIHEPIPSVNTELVTSSEPEETLLETEPSQVDPTEISPFATEPDESKLEFYYDPFIFMEMTLGQIEQRYGELMPICVYFGGSPCFCLPGYERMRFLFHHGGDATKEELWNEKPDIITIDCQCEVFPGIELNRESPHIDPSIQWKEEICYGGIGWDHMELETEVKDYRVMVQFYAPEEILKHKLQFETDAYAKEVITQWAEGLRDHMEDQEVVQTGDIQIFRKGGRHFHMWF